MAAIQLRGRVARRAVVTKAQLAGRLDLEPERIEQGLARLVLALVELVREVLERQAVRRMESGGLSAEQTERLGLALLRLDARMRALREAFGLSEDDVTLRVRAGS